MRAVRFAFVIAMLGLPGLALALGQHARTPPPPPPPPPPVSLALVANAPDRGWTVKLTNSGVDPVRIVADPRLLSFDVAASGHELHCTLPTEMIPTNDTERTLVVPGNRSWSVHIDPLLYCFGLTQAASLTPGAIVTAHFGWAPAHYAPPFVASPIAGDAGVGSARQISAPAVTLAAPDPVDAGVASAQTDGSAPTTPPPSDAYPVHMKITMTDRLDVARAFEQTVTVTIENAGDRPVRTLITPPTLGFSVLMPNGNVARCGADIAVSAIAELTTTLAPHARTSTTLDIGAICGSLLRHPGLYRIRPRIDTRRTAPPIGSTSFWAGESMGEPVLMRIRVGEEPWPMSRLDPPPP